MAQFKHLIAAVVAAAAAIVSTRYFTTTVQAQPTAIASNPRLIVTPTGVLDGSKGGVRAAFIKDVETGDCWLWVNEDGQGSALAPATKSACR